MPTEIRKELLIKSELSLKEKKPVTQGLECHWPRVPCVTLGHQAPETATSPPPALSPLQLASNVDTRLSTEI